MEKEEFIVRFCLAYKKTNRINKCVNTIGKALHECEGTPEDAYFAGKLLQMLGESNHVE